MTFHFYLAKSPPIKANSNSDPGMAISVAKCNRGLKPFCDSLVTKTRLFDKINANVKVTSKVPAIMLIYTEY
jgi:hypothetical protein